MTSGRLLFEDALQTPGASAPRASLRRGLLLVSLIWIGTRLLVWIGTYHGAFLLFRIEHHIDPPLEQHEKRLVPQLERHEGAEFDTLTALLPDFTPLCQFDGQHYRSIVEQGYRYVVPEPGEADRQKLEQNIAFFPLFPMLAWPLTRLMSAQAAMIVVVHVCSFAAAVLLYLWVRRLDERTALFTVAITFCWPASVYTSYAYAESLTLLLMVAALWLIDRRAWLPAAIVCGLATAVRPTALAIAGVLALAYWFNSDVQPSTRRLKRLVPLGVVAGAGIAAYALYLTVRFGSPLVYFANFKAGWVPDAWRASWVEFLTLAPVWEQFKYFRNLVAFAPPIGLLNAPNTLMWNMPLNLFIVFLSLAALPRVPRSFRPLLALGPLIFVHSYLASGGAKFGIEPIARYTAVAVPAFVVLAAWCLRSWPPAARTVLFAFFLLVESAWAFRFGLQEWSG